MSIWLYGTGNITLQNTDFGVLQKSSKHFLDLHFLSIICTFRTFPPLQKIYKNVQDLFLCYNFAIVKNCVLSSIFIQYSLYKITDFGVPQKLHLSIFWFPFSFLVPPPARNFVPRTMKTYFLQFCSLKCGLSIFIYNSSFSTKYGF